MDTVSPKTRSRVMARVRSKGNRSTEWRLRASLVRAGIRGWTLHSSDIPGKPDFAFRKERVLLFVDGCYWHGCPKCYRRPSSNTEYWDEKVRKNRARDTKTSKKLARQGWRLLRIWEHELSHMPLVLERVRVILDHRKKQ